MKASPFELFKFTRGGFHEVRSNFKNIKTPQKNVNRPAPGSQGISAPLVFLTYCNARPKQSHLIAHAMDFIRNPTLMAAHCQIGN
jgi:hypothetical protein